MSVEIFYQRETPRQCSATRKLSMNTILGEEASQFVNKSSHNISNCHPNSGVLWPVSISLMVDDWHWKRVSERKGIIVCKFLIFNTDSSDNVMFVYLVIVIKLIKLLTQPSNGYEVSFVRFNISVCYVYSINYISQILHYYDLLYDNCTCCCQ